MKTLVLRCAAIAVAIGATSTSARAALLYSVVGSTYTQNFNSLPNDAPGNASIESVYPNGWRDDTTTVAGSHISLPGWYLYHPLVPSSENGDNGHQRFRFSDGSDATGSFYAYANGPNAAANPEKAVGILPDIDLALPPTDVTQGMGMFIGLRIRNDTGTVIKGLHMTYDGEQWRDGARIQPNGDLLNAGLSLSANTDNWFSTAGFSSFGTVTGYLGPVSNAPDSPVDGNTAGKVVVNIITSVSFGFLWQPGTDLWLRWTNRNDDGRDDGLAIDNFTFTGSAVPEPATATLVGLTVMSLASIRYRRR